MTGFLIDPKIVNEYLEKPYDLKSAWIKALGQTMPPAAGELHYTKQEISGIFNELNRLYADLTNNCQPVTTGQKSFILSAGGPGAGKSTLLEKLLIEDGDFQNRVFSDPDERALKLMQVYLEDIEKFGGGTTGMALSYTKWRWASNYISNTIMNRANEDRYNILHGTTATSPLVGTLYDNAHKGNYRITTIIVAAPDDVRIESAKRRFEVEKTRFTADTKEKGEMFYERLPLLFEKTDNFRLYWREQVDGGATLAAKGDDGNIDVYDLEALSQINSNLRFANKNTSWEKLSSLYQIKP